MGVVPRATFYLFASGLIEDALGTFLIYEFFVFAYALGAAYLYFIKSNIGTTVCLILALLFLYRVIRYYNLEHRQPPVEFGFILTALVIPLQFFFDLSLALMFALLSVFISASVGHRLFPGRIMSLWGPTFVTGLSLFWLDWAQGAAVILYLAFTLSLLRLARRAGLPLSPVYSLLLTAICLFQLLSAYLPVLIPPGAAKFSPHLALSFCEARERREIFAAHPQCPLAMFSHQCKDAFIGVYDMKTLEHKRDLHLFDAKYYGRPEQLICHQNYLFVSMNEVRQNGVKLGPNTMLVDLAGEKVRTWKNFAGPNIGNSMLYDPMHDALFLTGEFDSDIFRWDFKTQAMNKEIGRPFSNPWYWPPMKRLNTGSFISHHDGYSKKHNTAYFSEWLNGRFVHEVDLSTLKPRRRFAVNGGAALGVTVDDDEGKLWISHLWGVSVFDLVSGNLLSKRRIGFSNRPAVIDYENDLVFMGSTTEGRIHVFDRKTNEHLETIALGIGSRYLMISAETRRLLASAASGSYHFDLSPGSAFIRRMKRKRSGQV